MVPLRMLKHCWAKPISIAGTIRATRVRRPKNVSKRTQRPRFQITFSGTGAIVEVEMGRAQEATERMNLRLMERIAVVLDMISVTSSMVASHFQATTRFNPLIAKNVTRDFATAWPGQQSLAGHNTGTMRKNVENAIGSAARQ